MPEQTTTRFETAQRYYCRSFGDHNCVWRFTVITRTPQTITIVGDGETEARRRSVRVWQDVERVDPLGRYSLSPVLSADSPEEPQP